MKKRFKELSENEQYRCVSVVCWTFFGSSRNERNRKLVERFLVETDYELMVVREEFHVDNMTVLRDEFDHFKQQNP